MRSHAVSESMKTIQAAIVIIALSLSGCASAPSVVETPKINQPIPPWPESVADTCPERKRSIECFRGSGFPKEVVREGFATLVDAFHGCIRPESLPVAFTLDIETLDGAPTCVDRSVRDNETARCVATVVARSLRLRDPPPGETCAFTFPFKFQMSDEDIAD